MVQVFRAVVESFPKKKVFFLKTNEDFYLPKRGKRG